MFNQTIYNFCIPLFNINQATILYGNINILVAIKRIVC